MVGNEWVNQHWLLSFVAFGWMAAGSVLLNPSEFIRMIPSAVTSPINATHLVWLAAKHAQSKHCPTYLTDSGMFQSTDVLLPRLSSSCYSEVLSSFFKGFPVGVTYPLFALCCKSPVFVQKRISWLDWQRYADLLKCVYDLAGCQQEVLLQENNSFNLLIFPSPAGLFCFESLRWNLIFIAL